MGEYEAIEPHGDKPDTQIVTFKDRKTAERFMYGTKNIPSVGKVELAWVTTPSATRSAAPRPDADDDTMMSNPDTNGNQPATTTTTAEAPEVDYDVAEEDDRWLAT